MSRENPSGTVSSAFTLVELLVVMAIIAVLAGILLPVLSVARERARETECKSNLRQVGMALTMYANRWDDYFPIVHGDDYENPLPPTIEWWEFLEPYGLKRQYMLCASDPHKGNEEVESYVYNGMFAFTKTRPAVKDPTGKIIVSERGDAESVLLHTGYPGWKDVELWREKIAEERHGDFANYLFVDGHVKAMTFADTLGEEIGGDGYRNNTNLHYLPEFDPPAP
jgi:prepilin-type N-terminal cleavage/methylation domain-containing protein/prepilin-type processing-associated H-X9-DG protein